MSAASSAEEVIPTVAAGIGNGVGGSTPMPTVVSDGTDERGIVSFGSGAEPSAGAQVLVTFKTPLPVGVRPFVYIQEINASTKILNCIPTSISNTGFVITAVRAPWPNRGAGTFLCEYYVKS